MPTESDGAEAPASSSSASNRREGNEAQASGEGSRNSRRNRNRNYRNNRREYYQRFEGREPSLKGYIYDVSADRHTDQYLKTTKEIIRYVGRTYKEYTADFTEAIETLRLDDPIPPVAPAANNVIEFETWKLDLKEHRAKTVAYENFKAGLYNILLGQCTEALEDRLKSHPGFPAAHQDGIALLTIIRSITHTFEERQQLADSLSDVKEKFYGFTQGRNMSLQWYHELFKAQVDVLDEVGVTIADESLCREIARENGRVEPNDADRVAAKQKAIAIRFIRGANARHSDYIKELRNSFLNGHDDYPATLHAAYNILQRREPTAPVDVSSSEGMAFATISGNNSTGGDGGPSSSSGGGNTRGGNRANITCFRCGERGHYANECEAEEESGTGGSRSGRQFFMNGVERDGDEVPSGYSFSQAIGRIIPPSWVLLDNQSTVDVFHNRALLRNIRESPDTMDIHCNAGIRTTNMIGDLPGYGNVWYDSEGIANILSLNRVKEKCRVLYDSTKGNVFRVIKADGKVIEFQQSDDGLYYMDAAANQGVVLINTVADKKANYTNQDYSRAVLARKIQVKIGRPSVKDYIRIVSNNQLLNCPITKADILAAEDIFGPDIGSLKGKTVRRPPHKVRPQREMLPPNIMSRYRNVTVGADIMFVNGIAFFISFGRNIRFGTVEVIPNAKSAALLKVIKELRAIYSAGGFKVSMFLMDGQFESLRGDLMDMDIGLNTTGRDEHVGEIERYIRTVKERVRATYNTLPFQRVPARIVIEMVKAAVFWLNSFPAKGGISDNLSPRTILTGESVDFNRHCKFEFGEYVQTHEQHDNSMQPRTVGALAMRPTGNIQGNFYFMSLLTGRLINRVNATRLPMPEEVIERVHQIARQQKANPGLVFMDRHGVNMDIVDDNEYMSDDDSDYDPDDEINDLHDDYVSDEESVDPEYSDDEDNDDHSASDASSDASDDTNDDDVLDVGHNGPENIHIDAHEDENNEHDEFPEVGDEVDPPDDGAPEGQGVDPPHAIPPENQGVENNDEDQDDSDPEGEGAVPANEEQQQLNDEMDARYGPRSGRYDLRERRRRQYGHLHIASGQASYATPQMNMKQGLHAFGERGTEAVMKEMRQLHERVVMKPIKANELSRAQKRQALAYLMFLKRKQCGRVKGRGCADGRKQRAYIPKEDAASPTVAIKSVFLTAVIDAMERRDVATVDIPGAFMQADMDELVHVRFTGEMVKLLIKIDPDLYQPCVVYEHGEPVIYVELLKALYGTLRAARLFWEKLSAKLKEWGFTINDYDSCVANKMIDGKQCTAVWHVDDLKISHVSPKVVDDVIEKINGKFGKEAPITQTRGKVHDYLGMTLDYSVDGEVKVVMQDYILGIIAEMPEEMVGTASSPAANHLFKVNENPEYLDSEKAEIFHHMVMQLQWLSQRGRPDIRTAVSFLCTRVQKPDVDDWKKLGRVMKYLQATIDLALRLSADGTGMVKWWVDAAFAVHDDMKGHTGATMSMGGGSIYSTSSRQKIVTRSSTECELVGVNDALPQVLWTLYFLEAQGFKVERNVLFQDNQSSILLEKNGRSSSSKRTRHINIRYFFIKNYSNSQEVQIEYCPTEEMNGDYFTKPLQGALFRKFRDRIMNVVDPSLEPSADQRSVLRNENADHDSCDVTNRMTYKDALTGGSESNSEGGSC